MMATPVSLPQKLRADDVFFPAMGLLILSIVVLGFAQTYFFAGMLRAKLPSTLVHIHGALFVSWIFLLTIQPSLVAIGRVTWHKTLGILGVILPPLMVVFGVLTLFAFIRRPGAETDTPPELLLAGDLEELALDVNLNGLFYCNRAAIPAMERNSYGRIVNIASIAGKEGNPNAAAYSASKAGVIGLTKSLGKELAKSEVRVNCVTPAAVQTPIFAQMSQQHIDYMLSKIPLGRFGGIDEVASLVCWLASEECSYRRGVRRVGRAFNLLTFGACASKA